MRNYLEGAEDNFWVKTKVKVSQGIGGYPTPTEGPEAGREPEGEGERWAQRGRAGSNRGQESE